MQVIGTSLKASQTLGNSDFNQPLGIIMGSEETGLSRNVESECDTLVKIAMSGEMDHRQRFGAVPQILQPL